MTSALRAVRRAVIGSVPRRHVQAIRGVTGPLLSPVYRGSRVECPCCDRRFRRFAPRFSPAGPSRSAARCPSCGALERHRALALYLRRETPIFDSPLAVLHVAPEPGIEAALAASPNLRYVTADLEAPATLRLDLTDIPFPDGTWHVIICNHVLEHIPDDRRAMAEIFRVLRPGGWGLLQVPYDRERTATIEDPSVRSPREREERFGQLDHVRTYGRDYPERLRQSGFQVTARDYALELTPEDRQRYGIVAGDDMFVCSKPAA